jgi:magnesium transporter
MARKKRNLTRKTGLPPGTLIYTGEKKTEKVSIHLIDYSENSFEEKVIDDIDECVLYKDKPSVSWINIEGIHDTIIIEKTGKIFDLHPLLLEDILNVNQRPKAEDFNNYLFFTLKMLHYDKAKREISFEQVSFVLGKYHVISFQEGIEGDLFDPIRERLKSNKGTIRKKGSDYLVYLLIDAIVDNYYEVLESLDETIEELEIAVMEERAKDCIAHIQKLKKDLIYLRKSIYPLREAISYILKGESQLVETTTLRYFKDVYDHTIYVFESLETYRDVLTGLLDVYLSSLSNKMNVVMKTLTIISTIFIPLTFIVGVYGMNFDFLPELHWKWSYPLVWLVMISISVYMVFYFKRKKWF